jgi:MoxR-like ATPase
MNVYLVGPTGSGKTHVAEQIARELDLPFYPISVGPQTSKSDLIGFIAGNNEYRTVAFYEAFTKGGVVLMDEADAAHAGVFTIVNAMTSNDVAGFPKSPLPEKKHKDFIVIAAANTFGLGPDRRYVGRNQLDAATRARFYFHEFNYDEKLEMNLSSDKKWCSRVQTIRAAINDLKEEVIACPRASYRGGALIEAGFTYAELEDALIFQGCNDEIKERILNRVGRS